MPELDNPVVFLGPTLGQQAAAQLAQADFKPPAAMGDITRAAMSRVSAIVLVDGVFESGPSVWHKEILLALSMGIPVIGASSMGALRAAELKDQGMFGYGSIYQAYAAGQLTDDDEVAVVHGPAETGWMQLTDAMVDIRECVRRAVTAAVLSAEEGQLVVSHAKSVYFKQRSLVDSVLKALSAERSTTELNIALEWFSSTRFSLKRNDCQLLLEGLPDAIAAAKRASTLFKGFEPTLYMNRLSEFGYGRQQQE